MSAPRLVLLPGLLCDATVWAAQCAALTQVACFVPSYGRLDSIERMARAVLDNVAEAQFALAGHSMGGRVALEMLRLAPARITRLAWLALAREHGMAAMARDWARGMVHPQQHAGTVFEAVVAMVVRHTPDSYEAQIQALLARPDAHETFAQVRCPTLLLCGRQDAWSPMSRQQQMQAERPSARLVVIEHAGRADGTAGRRDASACRLASMTKKQRRNNQAATRLTNQYGRLY